MTFHFEKAKDFKEPYASAAFQVLKSHNNQIVQKIAFLIEGLCYAERGALPSFNADEIAVAAALPKSSPIPVGGRGAWIEDWTKPPQAPAEEATSGLGWVAGHISIEAPSFSQAQRSKTLPLLLASGASFLVYLLPMFAGYSQLVLAMFVQLLIAVPAMGVLFRRYADEEAVKENARLKASKDSVESEVSIKRDELTTLRTHIVVAVAEQKKIELSNARDVSRIDTVLQATLKKISEDANRERQTLHGRKLVISSAEDAEKSSVQTLCAGKVNALKNEVNATNAQVNGELASELKKYQDRHLMSFLARYRIVDANLPESAKS